MDAVAETVLVGVGANELLRAGATAAAPGALARVRRGAAEYIEAVAAGAKRLSEGSNRDGGNLRDVQTAVARLGTTSAELSAFLSTLTAAPAAELAEDPEATEPPPFVSVFSTPVKQPSHIDPAVFGRLPPPHQWKRHVRQTPEKPMNYVEMRREKGREHAEMQDALVKLKLRERGGLEVEGYPHLRILRHTVSAPYLEHFS